MKAILMIHCVFFFEMVNYNLSNYGPKYIEDDKIYKTTLSLNIGKIDVINLTVKIYNIHTIDTRYLVHHTYFVNRMSSFAFVTDLLDEKNSIGFFHDKI